MPGGANTFTSSRAKLDRLFEVRGPDLKDVKKGDDRASRRRRRHADATRAIHSTAAAGR